MELCCSPEILLALEKACLSALQLISGKKYIGHSVVLIGMEKKLPGGMLVTELKFALGLGFGGVPEFKPSLFPGDQITGLKISADATDVENIPTSLLRFGH